MVGFPVKRIYTAVFRAFSIDDLEVEFVEEFWPLYLSLVEVFESGEISEVFVVYIYFHLVFGPIEVRFPFFEWFNDGY